MKNTFNKCRFLILAALVGIAAQNCSKPAGTQNDGGPGPLPQFKDAKEEADYFATPVMPSLETRQQAKAQFEKSLALWIRDEDLASLDGYDNTLYRFASSRDEFPYEKATLKIFRQADSIVVVRNAVTMTDGKYFNFSLLEEYDSQSPFVLKRVMAQKWTGTAAFVNTAEAARSTMRLVLKNNFYRGQEVAEGKVRNLDYRVSFLTNNIVRSYPDIVWVRVAKPAAGETISLDLSADTKKNGSGHYRVSSVNGGILTLAKLLRDKDKQAVIYQSFDADGVLESHYPDSVEYRLPFAGAGKRKTQLRSRPQVAAQVKFERPEDILPAIKKSEAYLEISGDIFALIPSGPGQESFHLDGKTYTHLFQVTDKQIVEGDFADLNAASGMACIRQDEGDDLSWVASDKDKTSCALMEPMEKAVTLANFARRKVQYLYTSGDLRFTDLKDERLGDCSEISRLSAAFLRKNGIAAQVAAGFMIYFRDNTLNIMGHAWNEYYDTKFKSRILLDPTNTNFKSAIPGTLLLKTQELSDDDLEAGPLPQKLFPNGISIKVIDENIFSERKAATF